MGLATVKQTEWGYYVTGDTDPTPIWTDGRRYVRTVVFIPAGVADTAELATKNNIKGDPSDSFTSWLKLGSGGLANHQECPWHLDDGVPADNMRCTLSDASGRMYIVVK